MKQKYLMKNSCSSHGNDDITLFFAGWGMDETPFAGIDFPQDTMLCCDYRDLKFDYSLLSSYSKVRVVGWSMGVWAAEQIIKNKVFEIYESIAVNGTQYPIDNTKGIPENIYTGTLDNLNEENLLKFYKRMCGNINDYNDFLDIKPKRNLEELKDELWQIRKEYNLHINDLYGWNMVYIGKNDKIFPFNNQKNAWQNQAQNIKEVEIAHYDKEFIKNILING